MLVQSIRRDMTIGNRFSADRLPCARPPIRVLQSFANYEATTSRRRDTSQNCKTDPPVSSIARNGAALTDVRPGRSPDESDPSCTAT